MPLPAMFKSLFKGKLAAPAEAQHTQEAALSEIDEKAVPADVGERRRGIAKIEALYRVFPKGSKALWALYASLFLYVYANTLGSSTVDSFYAFATSSFGEHAVLSTINVMAGIIGGVGQPFAAQLADTTSRPTAYLISVTLYTLGFIIIASANGVSAIAAGILINAIGSTGLDLVTSMLVADISPLAWRGFVTSLPLAPYIINCYIAGFITDGLGEAGWRWGYGMFAIMVPVVMSPALVVLFYADIKAKKLHVLDNPTADTSSGPAAVIESRSPLQILIKICSAIDALGLILLGFSWTLILLPFTLSASAADGYNNPSLIAMFVVGGILLIAFALYEWFYASNPILPKRVLNKAFIFGVIINATYYMSADFSDTYYSSWSYVVTNWNLYNWSIFSQTETVGVCIFGLLAGLAMRYTHRYKWVLVLAWVIRVLCYVVMYHARGANATAIGLAWTQILNGAGGGISLACVNVMVQASVPHEDLGIVISNLSLWTQLFGAIGSAVAGSVWTNDMPSNLAKYLTPLGVDADEITEIYGSITDARSETDDIRAGVISAYDDTVKPLIIASLATSFVPLIVAFLAKDFYLGKTQNAVDGKLHPMYRTGADADQYASPSDAHSDQRQSQDEKVPVQEKGPAAISELGRAD